MTGTKLLAVVVMLLVCGLLAAGCGDDEGSGSDSGTSNPSQTVTGLDEDAADAVEEATEKAKQGDAEGAEDKIREACAEQAKASLSGDAEEQAVKACEES